MLLQFILCKYIRVVWREGPDSSLFLSTLLLFKTRQQKNLWNMPSNWFWDLKNKEGVYADSFTNQKPEVRQLDQ